MPAKSRTFSAHSIVPVQREATNDDASVGELELFARQTRPGWTAWGDQTAKFDTDHARTLPAGAAGIPDAAAATQR